MSKWIRSWAYRALDLGCLDGAIPRHTMRVFFRNNIHGKSVRVKFDNSFGEKPLMLEQVCIAASDDGKTINDLSCPVTLDGNSSIVIAPKTAIYSDEIMWEAVPGRYLAVSCYTSVEQPFTTGCIFNSALLTKVQYCIEENCCIKKCLDDSPVNPILPIPDMMQLVHGISAVDISCVDSDIRSVIAFGDSITNQGYWTERLAMRLYDAYPGKIAFTNSGISGNRVLHDGADTSPFGAISGRKGVRRFEDDVFQVSCDLVLFLEGINDFLHPGAGGAPESEWVSAGELYDGIMECVDIAHRHGVPIIISTLVPAMNCDGWSQRKEEERAKFNELLRRQHGADGLIDFDYILTGGSQAELLASFDCGDHLHPNEAGGHAVADSIDVDWIGKLLKLTNSNSNGCNNR